MQTPIIQTLDSNGVSTYNSYGTNGTTPYSSREQVIEVIEKHCYVGIDIQGQEWFLKMFGRCRQCQPLALEFMPWNFLRLERACGFHRSLWSRTTCTTCTTHITWHYWNEHPHRWSQLVTYGHRQRQSQMITDRSAAIYCRYQKMPYYHKEYGFLVFLSCQLTEGSLSNHLRQTTQPCLWTTCNCQRMATTHSAISRTRHAVGVVARQYLGESRWTPDSRGCRMLATLTCSWKTFFQSSGGCRLEPGSFALLAACAFKGTYLGLVSEDSEQPIPQSIQSDKLCELLHPWG